MPEILQLKAQLGNLQVLLNAALDDGISTKEIEALFARILNVQERILLHEHASKIQLN